MVKVGKSRVVVWMALLVAGGMLMSCGGGSGNTATSSGQAIPNIGGAWEFIAVSSSGSVTGIEVALTEGQMLVNGVEQPDGQIAASSTQVAYVSLDPTTMNVTGFGGNCLPVTSVNSVGPGSVSALAGPITFTFTENGNVFNVAGTLGGDGKSMLNGTYMAQQSGNTCSDSNGTITGTAVAKLSGTYTGQMCPLANTSCSGASNFTDNVTATASENSSGVLTLSLVLTGTDNTSFTLSGPVTGNSFTVQGTFQGQTLTYYGYFEQIYNSTLLTDVPSIYLVNATNAAQPAYVGTLQVPQT